MLVGGFSTWRAWRLVVKRMYLCYVVLVCGGRMRVVTHRAHPRANGTDAAISEGRPLPISGFLLVGGRPERRWQWGGYLLVGASPTRMVTAGRVPQHPRATVEGRKWVGGPHFLLSTSRRVRGVGTEAEISTVIRRGNGDRGPLGLRVGLVVAGLDPTLGRVWCYFFTLASSFGGSLEREISF